MPVRILNVVRFPIGGIRSYLRYTYSRLDPEVYSTTIVTIDRDEAKLLPPGMTPLPTELALVNTDQPLRRLVSATRRMLRNERFDLIHSQGTTAAVVAALSNTRPAVPHVVTLHETFRAAQFAGPYGAVKRLLLGRMLGSADAIVTVSEDARHNLIEHLPLGRGADRVEVIRNGVAVDMLLADAELTRPRLHDRWKVDGDAILLGYIGRFMPEKGFDVLLDAVRLLPRHELPPFLVVAVNDGAFVREYRQRISEWGLDKNFLFIGFQSSASGTIQELDAVIMPSRREACPLVAMEAMTLGCPLIASDCIGLRELTAGTPALVSEAGHPQSLADAIVRFLKNPAEAHRQAQAFVPAARAAFDSGVAARRLVATFDRAMAARGVPRTRPA